MPHLILRFTLLAGTFSSLGHWAQSDYHPRDYEVNVPDVAALAAPDSSGLHAGVWRTIAIDPRVTVEQPAIAMDQVTST